MKVARLSALRTGHLYPQKIFLVLISVRGSVDTRAIVGPWGLWQWKSAMTTSVIEPATFWLVAQQTTSMDKKYICIATHSIHNCWQTLWLSFRGFRLLHICMHNFKKMVTSRNISQTHVKKKTDLLRTSAPLLPVFTQQVDLKINSTAY